ncbi:universal stress protein [Oceanisphaera avium]|nr:universal stress protein [Oceanisphaera avium]
MSHTELGAHPSLCHLTKPCAQIDHVLACVNGDASSEAVLQHACALATAFSARLSLLQVLEVSVSQEPMDPVEWTLHHYDKLEYLDRCLSDIKEVSAEAVIVAGRAGESIISWSQEHGATLIVLGRGAQHARLGDTARRVVEGAQASVLLVPSQAMLNPSHAYERLLIPLDGSCRAECALPLGLRLAAKSHSTLLIIHAAPHSDLIERDRLNGHASSLREQLYRHNEAAAQRYLDELRSRLPEQIQVSLHILPSADARCALLTTTHQHALDLVVLSATGKSGHGDMLLGSVADYLIHRLDVPVLLVRQAQPKMAAQDNIQTLRRPGQGM